MNDTLLVSSGVAIGAFFTGIISILNTLHKNKQEDRTAHAKEQDVSIDRLEKQLDALQKALTEMQTLHQNCREESAELRGHITFLHAYAVRLHNSLTKAGIETEPPPELPDQFFNWKEREFSRRTEATHEKLIQAIQSPAPKSGALP